MLVTQVRFNLQTIFLCLLFVAFQCDAAKQEFSIEEGYQALSDGDHALAYRVFSQLKLQGEPEASFPLALFYRWGWGEVKQDLTKACELFYVAARTGVPKAQQEYAHCLLQGNSHSSESPVVWLERAYQNGIYEAACDIGRLYLDSDWHKYDVGEALSWCHKAAERSAIEAQETLGDIYSQLSELTQAEFWYQQAIDNGSGESAFKLATLYLKAVEVTPSDHYPASKALYLMELASSHKVEQAYSPTAHLYWKKLSSADKDSEALLAKSYLWAKAADTVNSTQQTQYLLSEIEQELPSGWKLDLDKKVEIFLSE